MKKKFTETIIPEKIFGTNLEKFSKIGQEKKSLISNFAYFLTAIAKVLTSGRETGHWALSPPKF